MTTYRSGLRLLCPDAWEDGGRTFTALLIDDAASYVADVEADEVVTDVAASEVSATGYARALATTRVATWDGTNDRWRLSCATFDFGAIDAGTDVAGVVLAEVITDDTDSPLVTWHPFNAPVATDGGSFTVTIDADGLVRVA